jgi:hypothetical protein
VNDMCLGQLYLEELVHVGREGLKRTIVAHETMEIDYQQLAADRILILWQ